MRYLRMNGAGNAFAVFDARARGGLDLTGDQARAVAAESAADQIIVIGPSRRGADARLRFWNADGGEVGACGNGSRAAAWLLLDEAGVPDAITLETDGGALKASKAGEMTVTVDMGEPRLEWDQIPLAERMDTRGIDLHVGPFDETALRLPGAVNMGNPHIVYFVPDAEKAPVREVGSLVEHHPHFPEGVNVGFAQVLAPDRIRLRVWERGAGLTRACGTGACAALVAAHRKRLTGREATIIADGGELRIAWREADNHVLLTGPVAIDGQGDFAL